MADGMDLLSRTVRGKALFPHQAAARDAILQRLHRGCKGVLFYAPTGSGKTTTCAETLVRLSSNRNVLITAPSGEILDAWCRELTDRGVEPGIIRAGTEPSSRRVHVAMIQTLAARRSDPSHVRYLAGVDMVVVDEAHHLPAPGWSAVLDLIPGQVIGPTATPWRMDGTGLARWYDDVVKMPSTAELIRDGYLCGFQHFEPPTTLSMKGVSVRGGEYSRSGRERAVERSDVIEWCVRAYGFYGPGEPYLCWLPGLETCRQAVAAFRKHGWRCEMVSGDTKADERRGLIGRNGRLETGGIHVLVFSDLVREGVDLPLVCGILVGCPSKSTGLVLQVVGRTLRLGCEITPWMSRSERLAAIASSRKPVAKIVDFAGTRREHGEIDAKRKWTLVGGIRGMEKRVSPTRVCGACYLVQPLHAERCSNCGRRFTSGHLGDRRAGGSGYSIRPGTRLHELSHEELLIADLVDLCRLAPDRRGLEYIARERGYSAAWVNRRLELRTRYPRH